LEKYKRDKLLPILSFAESLPPNENDSATSNTRMFQPLEGYSRGISPKKTNNSRPEQKYSQTRWRD